MDVRLDDDFLPGVGRSQPPGSALTPSTAASIAGTTTAAGPDASTATTGRPPRTTIQRSVVA